MYSISTVDCSRHLSVQPVETKWHGVVSDLIMFVCFVVYLTTLFQYLRLYSVDLGFDYNA
jgi:hypothetical protein